MRQQRRSFSPALPARGVRRQERSGPSSNSQHACATVANGTGGGQSIQMMPVDAGRSPRQRGNWLGLQNGRRETHRGPSSVPPHNVPQAGCPIPVWCASPLATPGVSGTLGNDGECATLSQLSALSSSLDQLINVIRTQSVSQTEMSKGMDKSAAGVWSAVLAEPRPMPAQN